MARYDIRTPRLYVEAPLSAPDTQIALADSHTHYLRDVLRLKPDDAVLVFNGRDGEWRGRLEPLGKRAAVRLEAQTRPQTGGSDLYYLFAPLKRARLDYMVQKAVEMGVGRLAPVMTRYTQAERVNAGRMRANAIKAAEQCGVLRLPAIAEPVALARALAELEPERVLVFCDEDAPTADPVAALGAAAGAERLALLIGPEGGFAPEERDLLLARRAVVRLALGPRILRADTAAVAALGLVQAVLGDWRAG